MLDKTNAIGYFILAAANGGSLGEATKPILDQFFEIAKIVFPVLFAVVAIGIIARLIILALKLTRCSDDPEQRSRVIKGMIWWGVGLLIAIAAIATTAVVFTSITGAAGGSGS